MALVTLAEFKAYLKYNKGDQDTILQALLDATEGHLADLTDQQFLAGGTVIDEVHSGDQGTVLNLRRPASSITAIKVSAASDPANPDDTIPVADVRIDPVNDRRVVRFQDGVFPVGVFNLFVTYEAKANQPAREKEAVKEAAAMLYRIRGSEHVRSQSLGDLGSEVLEIDRRLESLPMWRAAVEHQKPVFILA